MWHRVQNTHGTHTHKHRDTAHHFQCKTCSQTSSTGRFNFRGVEEFIYTSTETMQFSNVQLLSSLSGWNPFHSRLFTFWADSLLSFWHEIYLLNNFPDECRTQTHSHRSYAYWINNEMRLLCDISHECFHLQHFP